MKKILIASNNKHKIEEFKRIFELNDVQVKLMMPHELYLAGFDVEETGTTFAENAKIKAIEFHKTAGMPVISDDSGLEVDCLDCKPGVFSARYAGTNAKDADNRIKLLEDIKATGSEQLDARFRCVVCYHDGEETVFGEGTVEGRIIMEERGENGFGYDPIFIPDSYDKTFAELPAAIKDSISHRNRALNNLISKLFRKEYNGKIREN
ncbi:MAG: RdgB/HAM1 family non-canonical purine NTP pyrophosphatase [Candidatus Kapaibacterium sp.]